MFPEETITKLHELAASDAVLENTGWLAAVEAAIAEMRKEIPMRPENHGVWSPKECPACGEELSTHIGDGLYTDQDWLDYCPNDECHQRLDWGDAS